MYNLESTIRSGKLTWFALLKIHYHKQYFDQRKGFTCTLQKAYKDTTTVQKCLLRVGKELLKKSNSIFMTSNSGM